MKTQNEISVLADQELDAVVGGRMNNGIGQREASPPGVAGSGSGNRNGLLAVGLGGIAGAALTIGIESLVSLL